MEKKCVCYLAFWHNLICTTSAFIPALACSVVLDFPKGNPVAFVLWGVTACAFAAGTRGSYKPWEGSPG